MPTLHTQSRTSTFHSWGIPLLLGVCAALAACSTTPRPGKPLSQQRELESLLRVAAYPNSDMIVVLSAMGQLLAAHREWDGYEYFGTLARDQPDRRALYRSLQAVMQARVAGDIGLLRRVAWVQDAIEKLDEGASATPTIGRLGRGLVFAELPARFGKARQAVDDLQASLEHRTEFPLGVDRGIYRALAAAYRTLGDEQSSQQMLARGGLDSLDSPTDPRVLTNLSVSAVDGFRFGERRFVREADDVYVAEGYDFANISFIVRDSFVVAIDAGTTERTARAAVDELRKVTHAPIKYVILTHAHWDHVGGLAAVREPGSVVIAQENFDKELARAKASKPPFQYFFGSDPIPLDVKPDRFVRSTEVLKDGDLELTLIPVHGGETEDALMVYDQSPGLLFVGDVFMPYLGAPFVAEGSPEGYLDAMSTVMALAPRRLLHGHPPLTALFTAAAMPGLRMAMGELFDRSITAAHGARPLADLLHDDFVPESLRSHPDAALPYLVARDTFVQRVYAEHAGYWQSNGEGMDEFTRGEWASALDLLGHSDVAFARASDDLTSRGDSTMALRIAELGLVRYPSSVALKTSREGALTMLRSRYSQMNPFRFIIYSEWAGRDLPPVQVQP
jgi:glyoxylase-like metal-dependent hydrolase (beta-lactamase superfamily II)